MNPLMEGSRKPRHRSCESSLILALSATALLASSAVLAAVDALGSGPIRVVTERLSATGAMSAPVSRTITIATAPLKAVGLTVDAADTPKPIRIVTTTLSAAGRNGQ